MNRTSAACVFLVVTALAQTLAMSQELLTGSIEGNVLDDASRPVEKATVTVDLAGRTMIGKGLQAITDADGKFLVTGVPAGDATVTASRADALYPDTRAAVFSSPGDVARVAVTSGRTTTGVVVRLHRGDLLSGRIVDALTNNVVLTARIRIIRLDRPNAYFSSSPTYKGDFRFALPAGKEYKIIVTAPEYLPWSGNDRTLVLQAGQVEDVLIRLTRQSATGAKPHQ